MLRFRNLRWGAADESMCVILALCRRRFFVNLILYKTMVSLTIDKRLGKIAGYNVQWSVDKKRYTIHLSSKKYSKKTVERVKDVVETLIYFQRNGMVPDRALENGLQKIPSCIQTKLAKHGLIVVNQMKTCRQLWDAFLKHKRDVKLATVYKYYESMRLFFKMFQWNEFIETVTPERLLDWKMFLLDNYAASTVAGHITKVKAVFTWAVDQDWLTKSPARKISTRSVCNRAHDRFITMEEYGKLLDACPSQEWRVIIALARIGGLRCPSELQRLRWKDVNWEQNRFLVHSPKTEQHVNHATRLVPLFAELRTELERLFDGNGNEFVVQSFQGTAWNLYKHFQTIAESTDLGKIKSPFVNMRRSRANEVVRRYGETKERLWIGHSWDVMEKHYLCPMEEDFAAGAADG